MFLWNRLRPKIMKWEMEDFVDKGTYQLSDIIMQLYLCIPMQAFHLECVHGYNLGFSWFPGISVFDSRERTRNNPVPRRGAVPSSKLTTREHEKGVAI